MYFYRLKNYDKMNAGINTLVKNKTKSYDVTNVCAFFYKKNINDALNSLKTTKDNIQL